MRGITASTWSFASCAAASAVTCGVRNGGSGFCSATFATGVENNDALGASSNDPTAAEALNTEESGDGDSSSSDAGLAGFGEGVRWEGTVVLGDAGAAAAAVVAEVAGVPATGGDVAAAMAAAESDLKGVQCVHEGAAKGAPVNGSAAAPGLNETSTRKRSGASTG